MSWSIMESLPNDLISVQGKQLWKQLLSKIWPFLTELKIISTPIDSKTTLSAMKLTLYKLDSLKFSKQAQWVSIKQILGKIFWKRYCGFLLVLLGKTINKFPLLLNINSFGFTVHLHPCMGTRKDMKKF